MMDSTSHLTEEERQRLVDGDGAVDQDGAVQAHLRACAACASDVAALQQITMRARQLAGEEPTIEVAELWPGIRSRIESSKVVTMASEQTVRAARVPRRLGAMAGIAALLMIAVWLGARTDFDGSGNRVARVPADTAAPLQFVDDSVRVYKEEAQVLLDRLELTRSMLEPGAAAAIDKDLAVIDSAIAELQTAIARDPRNPALQRLLAMSYREKIEVLLRVSNAG